MVYAFKISLTSPTRPSATFYLNHLKVTGTFPLFAVFMYCRSPLFRKALVAMC